MVNQKAYYFPTCIKPQQIIDATVFLFNNPTCEGNPVQNASTRSTSHGNYSSAYFFVKTEAPSPWSVFVSVNKTGFKSRCQWIDVIKPFSDNKEFIAVEEEEDYNSIIPTSFLDFNFNMNNKLMPDVYYQRSPLGCGINPRANALECFPACTYSAWGEDPKRTICPCKGIIGAGKYEDGCP